MSQRSSAQQIQQPRRMHGAEICPKHNEANVGYLEEKHEVVCNSCIYEK